MRSFFFLVALASAGCIVPDQAGDPSGTTTEAAGDPLDDADSSGADGPPPAEPVPPACASNPAFECAEPLDCTRFDCGGFASPFDVGGCLRPGCDSGADCPVPQICSAPANWGAAYEAVNACIDGRDGCICAFNPLAGPPAAYCYDPDELPGGARTGREYCRSLAVEACDEALCVVLDVVPILDATSCEQGEAYAACDFREDRAKPPDPVSECGPIHYRSQVDGPIELTASYAVAQGVSTGADPRWWLCAWDEDADAPYPPECGCLCP